MNIKENIANNITSLRKKNKWTQAELAERINYSDKAVSKWERGEAAPDIETLVQLAELFGVTVDYFVKEQGKDQKEFIVPKVDRLFNKLAILFLFSLATILIALCIFIIGLANKWENSNILWMAFVFCTPVLSALTYIFFVIHKIWLGSVISCSMIVATIFACIYLELLLHGIGNYWMIWLIAAILIGAIVLIYFMKLGKKPKQIKNKTSKGAQ